MASPVLQVVVGSTRPGRHGPVIAEWFAEAARAHGGFDVEVVDLAEVGLPLLDEPEHPRLGRYLHEHTRRWSATVERADALAFVVPEYNHSFNAATKNALDYLSGEWHHKPIGFVSYGGVAGGTRAVQALKPVATALKMMPIPESVNIPFFTQFVEDDGRFRPNELVAASATTMLDELGRWTEALRPLRAGVGA